MRASSIAIVVTVGVVTAVRALRSRPRSTVRYRVPAGHDPAAVLGHLRVAGMPATPQQVAGNPTVLIGPLTPAQRAGLDEVLRAAPLNLAGDASSTVGAVEEA